LINFKMSDMLHDPAKTCKHSSFFGSSPAGPNILPRPLKRLDWHLCMPPVGWLHERLRAFTRHPLTRPSPPGLAALLTVHGELRFSRAVKEPATEHLRMFVRASSDAHRMSSDIHRNLRVPPNASGRSTERLRTLTRAPSGAQPAAPFPHGRAFRGSPARPAVARTTSAVHRCVVFATSVLGCSRDLRVPPESLRRLTEASCSILAALRR